MTKAAQRLQWEETVSQKEFREKLLQNAEKRKTRLILALDTKDWNKAKAVLEKTAKHLAAVKIHPENPKIWGFEHEALIKEIKKIQDIPIILDAKLADIDSSNETKTEFFLNKGYDAIICHGFPGQKAVEAIVKKADELGKGVFLLTAMTSPGNLFSPDKVEALADMAKRLDVAGVIAPGNKYEITANVRSRIDKKQLILSPGVGAQGGEADAAVNAGTDFPIVGRALLEAKEPEKAAIETKDMINNALKNRKTGGIDNRLLRTLIEKQVLKFGDFTLKSGRKSTYFFNTGTLDDGKAMEEIGAAYADKIAQIMAKRKIDSIYGPAYKGIPLAVCTAVALWQKHGINLPVVYDRKEAKTHGDAKDKWMVGTIKEGDRLVLVDDVITTGETKHEAIDKLALAGKDIKVTDIIVLFNRQEKDLQGKDPLDGITSKGIEVTCILNARETFEQLKGKELNGKKLVDEETYNRFRKHQEEYGV